MAHSYLRYQRRLRTRRARAKPFSTVLRCQVPLLVEKGLKSYEVRCAIVGKPRIGSVANDGQHPRPRIYASEAAYSPKRPQASFLYYVLCVCPVPCKPGRDRKCLREMGRNHTCKLRSIFVVAQANPHRLKFGSIYSPIP